MQLNADHLLDYLLGRGLVSPTAAVDGDIRIIEGDRRHRHFRVERGHGPGLFVKQVRQWDAETLACLRREASCYRLAAENASFAALQPWVPAYRDYDPARHVLTTEYFAEARNMTQFHGQTGTAPVEIAEALGQALGEWHARIRIEPGDPQYAGLFPNRLPFILTLHRSPAQAQHPQGAGSLYVANTLRQDPVLWQAMDDLARRYQPTCLIHGDIKWDNLLVLDEDGDLHLRIVDWEIADIGDPLWDAAGVLQSYLLFWLLSMPLTSQADPNRMDELARFPLPRIQPALRAFWDAYAESRGLAETGPDSASATLRVGLRFAAARMTQTAYETGVAYGQPIPQVRHMMQLAQNILLKTDQAVHDLLGM